VPQKDFDPTTGGERVYSGVSKVINDFDPLDDAYQNDFPQAYITSPEGGSLDTSNVNYDAVIATKYGVAAAARAQAVRGTPVELPIFEDVQSKAPEVQLDEPLQAEDVPAAERSRLMLLKMRERYAEDSKSVDSNGRLDFNDERCVMGLDNATIYRHPGTQESITGAELKRKFAENKQLVEQMQILKQAAVLRAEQAKAQAEPPEDIQPFRTKQIISGVADASPDGKDFLREQINAVSREEFEGVATQIAEIHEMLASLTKKGDTTDVEQE
jgi:hypothetical protein